jgi:type I restriction enzyme, R subunit
MRPVGSMIEFKQIIGRGTRLFDGKDYFTIFDFVKAHHHFSDAEWDGEPEDITSEDGQYAPTTPKEPPQVKEPNEDELRPKKIKIKLRDGKERSIQNMMATSYYSADGTMMSSAQFLESLFGALPEFFKDEDELRAIWSRPDTRKVFMDRLAEKGFARDQMVDMQKIIEAEKSDLFDVLAFVAFAMPPITRAARAADAKGQIHAQFNDKQEAFLDFVLAQYVREGVEELDQEKLSPLLQLKYSAIADALGDLGTAEQIRDVFVGFQKYLYQERRESAHK